MNVQIIKREGIPKKTREIIFLRFWQIFLILKKFQPIISLKNRQKGKKNDLTSFLKIPYQGRKSKKLL